MKKYNNETILYYVTLYNGKQWRSISIII